MHAFMTGPELHSTCVHTKHLSDKIMTIYPGSSSYLLFPVICYQQGNLYNYLDFSIQYLPLTLVSFTWSQCRFMVIWPPYVRSILYVVHASPSKISPVICVLSFLFFSTNGTVYEKCKLLVTVFVFTQEPTRCKPSSIFQAYTEFNTKRTFSVKCSFKYEALTFKTWQG